MANETEERVRAYFREKKKAKLAQLQADLGLSYAQIRPVVDMLLERQIISLSDGSYYVYSDEAADREKQASSSLESLFERLHRTAYRGPIDYNIPKRDNDEDDDDDEDVTDGVSEDDDDDDTDGAEVEETDEKDDDDDTDSDDDDDDDVLSDIDKMIDDLLKEIEADTDEDEDENDSEDGEDGDPNFNEEDDGESKKVPADPDALDEDDESRKTSVDLDALDEDDDSDDPEDDDWDEVQRAKNRRKEDNAADWFSVKSLFGELFEIDEDTDGYFVRFYPGGPNFHISELYGSIYADDDGEATGKYGAFKNSSRIAAAIDAITKSCGVMNREGCLSFTLSPKKPFEGIFRLHEAYVRILHLNEDFPNLIEDSACELIADLIQKLGITTREAMSAEIGSRISQHSDEDGEGEVLVYKKALEVLDEMSPQQFRALVELYS